MNAGPATSLADSRVTSGRRRVLARTRLDFWLDAVALVAFTLAYSLGFTGIAAHEWLGIGLGIVLLVHITLHWDWVIRTTRKLLSPDGRERFVWLVNVLLLVSMTLCIASGILISEVALRTCEIEAVLAALVITVSAIHRRHRVMRRRAKQTRAAAGCCGADGVA
jgi:hypothetical protein